MTVVATFAVPEGDFGLGSALASAEWECVRVEAVVPTGDGVMPYVWISSADLDGVVETLRDHGLTQQVDVAHTVDEEALLYVEWDSREDDLLDAIMDADGVVLEAVGGDRSWTFEVRFSDYDDLSAFYRTCLGRDISIERVKVHERAARDEDAGYGLTPEQRRTLETAFERGYFDVPRGGSLVDLAEELDVSDSAVSQRVRRGLSTLIAVTLKPDGTDRERE